MTVGSGGEMSEQETKSFLSGATNGSRVNGTEIAARRTRTATLVTVGVAVLLGIGLMSLYIYADDSGRWAARKYAQAAIEMEILREECDTGLQERRLGRDPPVSRALCVEDSVIPEIRKHKDALRFFAIGDWGRDGMCCQRDVALRMNDLARVWKPRHILNTGDNFYHTGLTNMEDSQFGSSWSSVYGVLDNLKDLSWISVAGNHDHYGNVQAQLDLAKHVKLWHLPALTYFERYGDVQFAYVDTTPMYYSRAVLMTHFTTNFSTFEAIIDNTLRQVDQVFSNSDARWKVVVGHHPLYSTGSHFEGEPECLARMQTRLKQLMQKHKVAAYICGHEHSLEHAIVDGIHYFVSGAGSKVRRITGHMKHNVFAIGRQGFMAFAVEKERMTVYTIDMAGVVLHTAHVARPV